MTTTARFSYFRRHRELGWKMPAVLAVVVAVIAYVAARTSSDERVAQLWVVAAVADDGSAEILEVIDYDFGTDSRHGIFRNVPDLRTSAPVRVSSPDAPDDVTVQESFLGFDPQIRIGDPDETVSGQHRYVLRYTLDDVASDGRIAWDAVGTEWDVPIEDVEVRVLAAATLEEVACRTGVAGSTDPCPASADVAGQFVATVGHLDPGEGVTVTARAGEALDAAPPLPDPPAAPPGRGVPALALAALALLVALLAGVGAKYVLRRADRHHAPRLGLPGQAPGESTRVDAADLADHAAPSSRLPDGLTPAQGGVLLSGHVQGGDMAAWLAEQAAAGVVDFEPAQKPGDEAVVMVRRRPGDGVVRQVLDRAFGNRERLRLGTFDSRFAAAWKQVEQQLTNWRDTSGFWDPAARRRAKLAKRVGLVTGAGGLVLVVVGATMAASAGPLALALTALGAALTAGGLCVGLSFWGSAVLTPEGTSAWLQVESLRRFLVQSPAAVDDADVPTDRLGDYTAWAVALGASERWSRIASRVTGTSRTPVDPRPTRSTAFDTYYWIRHAALADHLATSCYASSHPPRTSTSSSGGSSRGSSYSSSSSSVGSGSGGGGGGSW